MLVKVKRGKNNYEDTWPEVTLIGMNKNELWKVRKEDGTT